ncbi:MAG: hypothetical protein JSV38_11195 [Desulfobacterales bacterium]|nr:MAG: hypothetical protein JSV38_11195 [Desulfobacterales bacterium]
MKGKRWMTIFFTDGTKLKFDFPKQRDDTSNIGAMIKEAMNQNQLILEVESTMFTVPFVNVKYIQIYPCPEKLPDTAIRGVKLID